VKKIYFFGLGKGKSCVDLCLRKENVDIVGFIDNGKAEQICEIDGIPVIKQNDIKAEFDYIIVSLLCYENVKEELIAQGITEDNVICFYNLDDAENPEYWSILEPSKW